MREFFLNWLYEILGILQEKLINDGFHFLADPVPPAFIQSSLYFFFDPHIARGVGGNKIVRVGITGDNGNNRLLLHQNGHIGVSVFRRHVHNALEQNHEPCDAISISHYIHPLQYLYLPIADHDDLTALEKRIIEIVSNRYQPILIDTPPIGWLGYNAINPAIRESHLWNVHHVGNYQHNNEGIYNDALALLNHYVGELE
jgi:hypothetical protein